MRRIPARFRVATLMALVAIVAPPLAGGHLYRRSATARVEARRHDVLASYWADRRAAFLADITGPDGTPASEFLFHSRWYDDFDSWEAEIDAVIGHHQKARRGFDRIARRPWESSSIGPAPEWLPPWAANKPVHPSLLLRD